jgi:Fe2+ transport system protein B
MPVSRSAFDVLLSLVMEIEMKRFAVVLGLSVVMVPAFAQKPCEELKSEIAANLDKKGVKKYQLEIVVATDVKDQKVVGSCERGKKKITYRKG